MKYTSIKSVLFSLSTLIDEKDWNETYFLEWAVKGSRKLNLIKSFVDKVCVLDIVNNGAQLPADCQEVTMIVVQNNPTTVTSDSNRDLVNDILNLIPTNPMYKYLENTTIADRLVGLTSTYAFVPMRRSTSPFLQANNKTGVFADENIGGYEYTYNPDGSLYTSIESGTAVVAYKGYPTCDDEFLIPDHEDVKDAIESFVLLRFYESKAISGDQMAERQRAYYQDKFYRMSMKAKSLNMPTLDDLENISNMQGHLKKQQHQYDKLFSSLGYKEKINFSHNDAN